MLLVNIKTGPASLTVTTNKNTLCYFQELADAPQICRIFSHYSGLLLASWSSASIPCNAITFSPKQVQKHVLRNETFVDISSPKPCDSERKKVLSRKSILS